MVLSSNLVTVQQYTQLSLSMTHLPDRGQDCRPALQLQGLGGRGGGAGGGRGGGGGGGRGAVYYVSISGSLGGMISTIIVNNMVYIILVAFE